MPHLQPNLTLGACQTHLIFALVLQCAKLNLVLAGPQLPKKIRALASYKDYTFAAYGSDIAVFKRTDQVVTWSRHEEKVNMLYLFENMFLVQMLKVIYSFGPSKEQSQTVSRLEAYHWETSLPHPVSCILILI